MTTMTVTPTTGRQQSIQVELVKLTRKDILEQPRAIAKIQICGGRKSRYSNLRKESGMNNHSIIQERNKACLEGHGKVEIDKVFFIGKKKFAILVPQ